MRKRQLTSALTALVLTGTGIAAAGAPSQAASEQNALGTRSIGKVLAADGHHFDHDRHDFDVYDYFVRRILRVKPNSELRVLFHGRERVTAFLQTDGAFRRTADQIIGRRFAGERRLARAMWRAAGSAGVVEQHLLYDLVPGATITYRQARQAAPTEVTTLEGGLLKVRYRNGRLLLVDYNPDSPNAHVIRDLRNINVGNRQIAHGTSLLMSPIGAPK